MSSFLYLSLFETSFVSSMLWMYLWWSKSSSTKTGIVSICSLIKTESMSILLLCSNNPIFFTKMAKLTGVLAQIPTDSK